MDNNIFHGSNVEVAKPRILQNGFYKDFGYGFYCTEEALKTLTFEGSEEL